MSHINTFGAAVGKMYHHLAAQAVLRERQARGEGLEAHQLRALEQRKNVTKPTTHADAVPNSPTAKLARSVDAVSTATPSQILDSVKAQRNFLHKG